MKLKKKKEISKANKNSGLSNGDGVNTFIKDLYSDYDIYNNYLTFFDKSFTSPLSRTGIDVYNINFKNPINSTITLQDGSETALTING